jgi:hypothetical protein
MTVAEFVDTYYRPERLHALPGRHERIIADRETDIAAHGSTLISHHDCVTGRTVWMLAGGRVAAGMEG